MLNNTLSKTLKITALALMVFGSATLAAKNGHIKLTSHVEKVITVTNAQGKQVQKTVPAEKVLPGEVVHYSSTFENVSNKGADNIGITNPIPQHTVYVAGSAHGQNCDITFSVDGGKSWARPEALKVRGKDGKVQKAKPADYTHIKWKYRGSLKPKEVEAVGFKARLL